MKYYCLGIKGTGMSTLAQILSDLGNTVSGYDDAKEFKFTQVGLDERNIPIYYDQDHVIDEDTIVTYSVALSEDHKELKRIKSLGLKVVKYNEIMGQVIDMFKSIGVSGTHGKTTTSSLIRHILEDDCGCNYFIGAGDGYATKDNDYFVVESDEFNRHFTAYHPMYSVITNIEEEHMECYKDINDIRNTFQIFANQTKKLVVANGDNTEVKKINYKTNVIFYGFGLCYIFTFGSYCYITTTSSSISVCCYPITICCASSKCCATFLECYCFSTYSIVSKFVCCSYGCSFRVISR